MPGGLYTWLIGLLFALALTLPARAAIDAVQEIHDLSPSGPLAERADMPLLLVFTADDCPYCMRLAEEVLIPMLRSGEYDDRVVIRALNLSGRDIVGFDGERTKPWTFARRFNVKVTPTLIVFDSSGKPLAEPMVGLGTTEYFEYLIATTIEQARASRLHRNVATPAGVQGSR